MDETVTEFRRRRAAPPVPRSWQVRRLAWSVVEATLFRCSFHTSNRWRATLLRAFGASIAPGSTIRRTCRVYYPWLLQMGAVSCLGDRVVVYNLGPITIGDRVMVSQEAYLCAGTHDYTTIEMPLVPKPIQVGSDAWICARAFVSPGVSIGEGAIVGAGSVITRSVPAWTIVAGNPARHLKNRERLA